VSAIGRTADSISVAKQDFDHDLDLESDTIINDICMYIFIHHINGSTTFNL